MANICYYEIRVIGTPKQCQFIYDSMPCYNMKDEEFTEKRGDKQLLCFTGDCKWSVNYGVEDEMEPFDVESMSEEEVTEAGEDAWEISLRAKSEALGCEIMVHYWSWESEFDQFDHFKDGKTIKRRKIAYEYDEETGEGGTEFDWETTEFVGHEGECDEDVDGEERDNDLMSMLSRLFGGMSNEPENDYPDRYFRWSFDEGKRAGGDGWSIAVPDGFAVLEDAERPFKLVPADLTDEAENAVVCILPGISGDPVNVGDEDTCHPLAKRAAASAAATQITEAITNRMANDLGGLFGNSISVHTVEMERYATAAIMTLPTSSDAYSFQAYVTADNCSQMMRVQTQEITSDQKKMLEASLSAWFKTMLIDGAGETPLYPVLLEDPECCEAVLKGDLKKLEAAVEQANDDCRVIRNCRLGIAMNMLWELSAETVSEYVRQTLLQVMEATEYFVQKADRLVDTLIERGIEPDALKKALVVLKALDDDANHANIDTGDDEPLTVTVDVPETVQAAFAKWDKLIR